MSEQVTLLHTRCFHHHGREAVARCPQCGRYFCRECITEHEGKVLCASCIAEGTSRTGRTRLRFASLVRLCACAGGFFLLWFMFHQLGEILLAVPTSFHEGTIWREIGELLP